MVTTSLPHSILRGTDPRMGIAAYVPNSHQNGKHQDQKHPNLGWEPRSSCLEAEELWDRIYLADLCSKCGQEHVYPDSQPWTWTQRTVLQERILCIYFVSVCVFWWGREAAWTTWQEDLGSKSGWESRNTCLADMSSGIKVVIIPSQTQAFNNPWFFPPCLVSPINVPQLPATSGFPRSLLDRTWIYLVNNFLCNGVVDQSWFTKGLKSSGVLLCVGVCVALFVLPLWWKQEWSLYINLRDCWLIVSHVYILKIWYTSYDII